MARGEGGDTPANARAAASPGTIQRYNAAVSKALEAAKRNTARRGQVGLVEVEFVLDPRGNLQEARLTRASGNAALDDAVLRLVKRAASPPRPPDFSASS